MREEMAAGEPGEKDVRVGDRRRGGTEEENTAAERICRSGCVVRRDT